MSLAHQDDLFLVVAPGLESVLAAESSALGFQPASFDVGGITMPGSLEHAFRANLELRTASRVLVRVATFHARLFAELERRARRVEWQRFIPPGTAVAFRVTSRKSRLYHPDAIAERLASAVPASVSGVTSAAGSEDAGETEQLFVVRVFRDLVTISADSSGALLHRRGYRLESGKAPLRETLAAAMLLASGWDGTTPLVDPMMGSGTIPIEAALIARRAAPGLARSFACERWPGFDRQVAARLRDAARERARPSAGVPILGFDRDAGAVELARDNADRAGVRADIECDARPISALPPLLEPGSVVTNPPYGARVGDRRSLRNLYARLGAVVRERCPRSSLTLLVGAPEHEHALGLPCRELFRTTNGGIRVRCLQAGASATGPSVA